MILREMYNSLTTREVSLADGTKLEGIMRITYTDVMKRLLDKYNATHEEQLPRITPHVLRHTFCTRMAERGMNPKTLQYLMGHADITVTLNVYTHASYTKVADEMAQITAV